MRYWKYLFEVADSEQTEILLAFLSEWPFDSFQETETGLEAYLAAELLDEVPDEAIQELAARFNTAFSREELPDINWNATWEANFHPIIIDRFCAIRADFHDPIPEVKYEIIINPKAIFGLIMISYFTSGMGS